MDFASQKKNFLAKPDKSGIGGIDKAIKNLVKSINDSQNFYTTSSCAGRIILMKETGKKQESVFLFVSHGIVDENDVLKALSDADGIIYFKHEPCILHVACRNLESAQRLVTLARQSGWKKSGIISIKRDKIMAELVSTEILAAPISKGRKLAVSMDYLRILAEEANKKLKQTREKIRKLEINFS